MWIEETVDRESQQKLYVQIYHIVRSKIEKGEWPESTLIPSEDELCRMFDVSKATIRLAVTELVREGYLKRQQGKGTFVSSAVPHSGMAMKTRLTEELFGEGVNVSYDVLAKGVKPPPEEIKAHLMVTDTIYYARIRASVDNEPAYYKELFISPAACPGIEKQDLSQASFYDLIQERSTRKIFKVIQTIEVALIKSDAAEVLKVKEGCPALLIHRLLIGSDGRPIAYTRHFGSGRKYKLQAEFERIK